MKRLIGREGLNQSRKFINLNQIVISARLHFCYFVLKYKCVQKYGFKDTGNKRDDIRPYLETIGGRFR